MLKNYFKVAIAVLKRRKFFTFISLFGISFTLTILIVVAALIDHLLSGGYPDANHDRELFIDNMWLRSSKNASSINGGPSFYFFDQYVSKLKTQEKLAILSSNRHTSSYGSNKKLVIDLKYTNHQFWDVFQFLFIEGKPYDKQQVDNSDKVAVISEDARNKYFGNEVAVAGKYIETDNVRYRVIGVVKSVPATRKFAYADIYVPYTLSKSNLHSPDLTGDYSGVLLLHSAADIPKMKEEFRKMVSLLPPQDKTFDIVYTFADTYFESVARSMVDDHSGKSGIGTFLLFAGTFLLLFLLLPTINLVNINISRILDRSSEIGVRKAFGASSKTLVYQFIIENLILTCIGGMIGVLLSFVALQIVNNSGIVDNAHFSINFRVLSFGLFACILFGLLSGAYPAWRMSRMNVVTALKAQ